MTFTPNYTLNTWDLPFRNNGLYQPATHTNTGFGNMGGVSSFGGFGGFGGFNNFCWNSLNTGIFPSTIKTSSKSSGSSSTTSISGIKVGESFADFEARMAKEKEKNAPTLAELKTFVEEQDKAQKELETQMEELEARKKADGSSENVKKLSEMTGLQKAGVVASGLITGTIDTIASAVKTLAGFDRDGKWSLGRCLAGVGGTALLALACTPAAAALIPALAFAGPALAVLGVAGGLTMAGFGIANSVKAVKHDNADELKQGVGQIAAGALTVVTAGKSFKAQAGKAGVTVLKDANGKRDLIGAAGRFKSNVVNSFETSNAHYNDVKAIKATTTAANQGAGKLANYKQSLNQYRINLNKEKVSMLEANYNKNYSKALKDMNDEVTAINQNLRTVSDPAERSLLTARRDLLNKEIVKLCDAEYLNDNMKTWQSVGSEINTEVKALGWKRRVPFTAAKRANKSLKSLQTPLKALQKEKFDLVTQMSKTSNYKTAVENFGFSSKHRGIANYWTGLKATVGGMSTGQKVFRGGMLGLSVLGPQYTVAPIFSRNPFALPGITYAGIAEFTKHGMGDMIPGCTTIEEVSKETMEQYRETLKATREQLADIKKMRNDLECGTVSEQQRALKKYEELKKAMLAQAQAAQTAETQAVKEEMQAAQAAAEAAQAKTAKA